MPKRKLTPDEVRFYGTDPDVDAGPIWPAFISDLTGSATVRDLPSAARWFYMALLMEQHRVGGLPNDPAQLADVARIPRSEDYASAWRQIEHLFPVDPVDGKRRNDRAIGIRAEWASKRKQSVDRAKVAAATRWKDDPGGMPQALPQALPGGMQSSVFSLQSSESQNSDSGEVARVGATRTREAAPPRTPDPDEHHDTRGLDPRSRPDLSAGEGTPRETGEGLDAPDRASRSHDGGSATPRPSRNQRGIDEPPVSACAASETSSAVGVALSPQAPAREQRPGAAAALAEPETVEVRVAVLDPQPIDERQLDAQLSLRPIIANDRDVSGIFAAWVFARHDRLVAEGQVGRAKPSPRTLGTWGSIVERAVAEHGRSVVLSTLEGMASRATLGLESRWFAERAESAARGPAPPPPAGVPRQVPKTFLQIDELDRVRNNTSWVLKMLRERPEGFTDLQDRAASLLREVDESPDHFEDPAGARAFLEGVA